MIQIQLDIDLNIFKNELIKALYTPDFPLTRKLLSDFVISQFENRLNGLVASKNILRFKIDWLSFSETPISLKELIELRGIYLERFRVTLITEFHSPYEFQVLKPNNLNWITVIKKTKQMKESVHHIFRIYELFLPTKHLENEAKQIITKCECPSDLLMPYLEQNWDWFLRFMCKICGSLYYCECFKKALEKTYLLLSTKAENTLSGVQDRFMRAFKHPIFRKGICHLCRNKTSDIYYCNPMYGSDVLVHYGPYIARTAIEKSINQRDAENEIRDILGIPHIGEGWISEIELLNFIRDIFPLEKIFHHARPNWLKGKHIDIFLPNQKIAIEYQGLQHYKAVDFFGGKEAFTKVQERDKNKAELCKKNGISIIYFRYDEKLSKDMVKERIYKKLGKI